MADWWWRRRVVVAVVDDDDSSFAAASAALLEAPQGGALALRRHLDGVLACPFKGRVVVALDLAVLRLHGGEPRLCLHRREPQLRLCLDEARRRSRRGGAPASLVDDDAGAASAPAERRLRRGLGLEAEQCRSARGVRGRARGGGRRGGAEPPWRPWPVASVVRLGGRPRRGVRQRRVVAALEVRQHTLKCAAGGAPPQVAPLAVLHAADHRRPVGGRSR